MPPSINILRRKWRRWVGSIDAVARVAELCRDALGAWPAREMSRELEIIILSRDDSVRTLTSPEDLRQLDDHDVASIWRLTIKASSHDHDSPTGHVYQWIEVQFRHSGDYGAELEVRSLADRAHSAAGRLTAQIAKGAPRFGVDRWVILAIGGAVGWALGLGLAVAVGEQGNGWQTDEVLALSLGAGVPWFTAAALWFLLPHLEIMGPSGGKSRLRRYGGYAVSVLAIPLAVGLALNYLLT